MRSVIIALVLATLFVGSFVLLPITGNVRADSWYSSQHATYMPSAYNGNFTMPIGSTPTSLDYGPRVWLDGNTWIDLYSRYGSTVNVTTGNFNNPAYPGDSYLINGLHIFDNMSLANGDHAPTNATVTNVWVVSMWSSVMNQPWVPLLNMKMTYKIGTWWADRQPAKTAFANPMFTCIGLNVTGDRTWNSTLLRATTLQVRLTMNLPANTLYNLDYLGIMYAWYFNVPGTPGFVPDSTYYPGNLTVPSAIGAIGVIGFSGMIAIPAAGIWMARRSDEPRMLFGLKLMLAFVVCMGLFLASIS
jgi:hypothetical protein